MKQSKKHKRILFWIVQTEDSKTKIVGIKANTKKHEKNIYSNEVKIIIPENEIKKTIEINKRKIEYYNKIFN